MHVDGTLADITAGGEEGYEQRGIRRGVQVCDGGGAEGGVEGGVEGGAEGRAEQRLQGHFKGSEMAFLGG